MHLSIRDRNGNSAVVEFKFINGKIVVNENAKNVMTNLPAYLEQLKNTAKYAKIVFKGN